MAVSADGRSVYVTDANDDALSQYDVGARGGALTPKTPATVPAGTCRSASRSTRPCASRPTRRIKGDGWRGFPQFKNQGTCVSFVATGG